MNAEINYFNVNKTTMNTLKKRVLFVITQEDFGGAQKFLYEFVTRLNGDKYDIMVASGKKEKGHLKSLEENINTHKLKFLKREINPFFDFLALIQLISLINRFRPDILHLNSSKTGVLGSIAGKTLKLIRPKVFGKLKIIYRIGGWSFNDPVSKLKKLNWVLAEKITARFKDIIIVNSKSDFDQAIRLKIKPKKEVKLIHNGLDALKIGFLSKEEAKLKLFKKIGKSGHNNIFQTKFFIGTIANFYQTKGLDYLIEAFNLLNTKNQIQDVKLLLIGDGRERVNLEKKISDYGLKEKVILLGQIPEAFKYIEAFDVFVLPSVKEGFPWAILEAMAAKVPVISTSVGAVPEIIENGKNGILVEPKSPGQLAEAIQYLLENERVRQELALQGHQTVLFKFPIEKMIKETEELFNL